MWINEVKGDSIKIDFDTGNVLNGYISMRVSKEFSFAVKNSSNNKMQIENILALDGVFDGENENFQLKINESLKTGNYLLYLYDVNKDIQDSSTTPQIDK